MTTAVLLLAHGSPETPADVPEFLRNVTGGRPVPQHVVEEIVRRYALIGRSPLHEITRKQAEALEERLGLRVYVGMRNWTPYIPDVVRSMADDNVQRAVAICLAPQNSRTSVGLYRRAVFGDGGTPLDIEFVESWHDHPLLVRAFAERLEHGWGRACGELADKATVIFTAHSVPLRTILEGDPYERQARETAELVAKMVASLGAGEWTFAFQSQGMSGEPWIGPTVEDTILDLKRQGHGGVFIQPIGFLCDHVEVLYDIDIGFRQLAEREGLRFWRAESLNGSPALIEALADLARSRLQPEAGAGPGALRR